jgi:hypothetical protein
MPPLTDDQLIEIAQELHDVSATVAQFRLDQIHEGAKLDDPLIVQLLGLQFSLQNKSSSFSMQAAQVTLANADQAAATITSATKQATDAIQTLSTINKVISIGSAVIVLATAVMTGDMGQIGSAAQGVFDAVGDDSSSGKSTTGSSDS